MVTVCLCHSVQYNQYLPVTQRGSTRISIRCRCLCSDTATKWPSPGCADKILGVTSVIFCKFTLSPLQAQNLGSQALMRFMHVCSLGVNYVSRITKPSTQQPSVAAFTECEVAHLSLYRSPHRVVTQHHSHWIYCRTRYSLRAPNFFFLEQRKTV